MNLIDQYRARLNNSILVFRSYKEELKEGRQAYNQVLPASIVSQSSDYSDVNPEASKLIHPALAYISKKFIEDITAIPFRYEWASNDNIGVQVVRESEKMIRTLFTQSHINSRNQRLIYHSVIDGLAITQTTTYVDSDRIIRNKNIEEINQHRVIDMAVYDPINTYLDPNADGTDIANTSEYIIVTLGIFDENWVRENFPDFFESDVATIKRSNIMPGNSFAWLDDGEDTTLAVESGMDKRAGAYEQYKIREYYTGDGFYFVVINDNWISDPFPVSNGIADRIPFNIVQILTTPDQTMGKSLYTFLKNPIIMASKALNMIADSTEMANNVPMFTYEGSGIEFKTLSDFEKQIIVPVVRQGDVKQLEHMFYRPNIKEITPGAELLLNAGNDFIMLLAGTNTTEITGQQTPQIKTNVVAQLLHDSAIRSNSSMTRNVEAVINGFLFDIMRMFYIYFEDFGFDTEAVTADFFKNNKVVRVVPGSSFAEDRISRIERGQTVLDLAMAYPDGFNVVDVFEEYLEAIGARLSLLKSPEESLMQQMAMAIAQNMGENWSQDKELLAQMQQLAELASQTDVGKEGQDQKNKVNPEG